MTEPISLKTNFFSFFVFACSISFSMSNESDLWLNYTKIYYESQLDTYRNHLQSLYLENGIS